MAPSIYSKSLRSINIKYKWATAPYIYSTSLWSINIKYTWARVILHIIAVFAFPPRAGCKIRVSLLSLYGTWPLHKVSTIVRFISRYCFLTFKTKIMSLDNFRTYPWLSAPSLSFLITVPNVIKLLFMWEPSLSLTPSAPVFAARSDPARSTKF